MLTIDKIAEFIKTAPEFGGLQISLSTDPNEDLRDRIRQINRWLLFDEKIHTVRIFSNHKELGYIERKGFIDLAYLHTILARQLVREYRVAGSSDGGTGGGGGGGAGNLYLPGLKPDLGARYVCPVCGAELFVLPEDEDFIEMPPKCKNTSKHSEPAQMNLK